MNKIEVLNFYDELTNDQKQSFMSADDTLGVLCSEAEKTISRFVKICCNITVLTPLRILLLRKAIKRRMGYVRLYGYAFYMVAEHRKDPPPTAGPSLMINSNVKGSLILFH